ncbi:MAG: DUF1289 domain-containing protein [Rhizomicrobium sp.]
MPIQSPCNKICTIDSRGAYCIGCGRTLDEIARWASFSDEERAQIMRALAERRARAQAAKQ